MEHDLLLNALVYLAAAVIAVPVAKRLGLGAVLGYLLAGAEPPAPDFARPCPWLGSAGCQLPVARRPFNCIIFLCEPIDARLTAAQRAAGAAVAAAETAIHWLSDYGKCARWYSLHVDQAIHIVCKLAWWALVAGEVVRPLGA